MTTQRTSHRSLGRLLQDATSFLACLIVILVSATGCGGGGGGDAAAPANQGNGTRNGGNRLYQGTAFMTFRTFNPLNPAFFTDIDYRMPVTVSTGPPLVEPDAAEPNPFQLVITTDGTTPELGAFSLWSSSVITTPITLRRLLLVFWRFQVNGTRIQGTLADNHFDKGIAVLNSIFTYSPGTFFTPFRDANYFAVRSGTDLDGFLDDAQIDVTITGSTEDTFTTFSVRVVANRTER